MSEVKPLTSDLAATRIDRVLDNMDLPCDASEAWTIISALTRDYAAWQRTHAAFVKKNAPVVAEHEKFLASLGQGYQNIRAAMRESENLDEDCVTNGRIWLMMQEVSWQLARFQPGFCHMLERAQEHLRAAPVER